MEIADRIVVIHEGALHQDGPPDALLARPTSAFVREFLGEARLLDAQVEDGSLRLDPLAMPGAPEGRVRVAVRGLRVLPRT
ncbi:MAG: hypothetical protein IT378_17625 [Sandaracinaceae bacterium]|nr:hypothetical protein [Sandaracinaceae bacterium]